MGLREKINNAPGATTWIAIGVLVVALAAIGWQLANQSPAIGGENNAFFTIDEGKTRFTAPEARVPPFDHEGKQAVRAYVYKCGGTEFVAYLERYSPEAKKAKEASQDPNQRPKTEAEARAVGAISRSVVLGGREVKRPGDATWVRFTDAAAAAPIVEIKCPGGSQIPEPVLP